MTPLEMLAVYVAAWEWQALALVMRGLNLDHPLAQATAIFAAFNGGRFDVAPGQLLETEFAVWPDGELPADDAMLEHLAYLVALDAIACAAQGMGRGHGLDGGNVGIPLPQEISSLVQQFRAAGIDV